MLSNPASKLLMWRERTTAVVVGLAVIGALLLMVGLLAPEAQAAPGTTITVNTKADEDNTDGDCSLREAMRAADENTGVDGCAAGSDAERDAILFSIGDSATITLGSELPEITDGAGLAIDGQTANIKVSGKDAFQVFRVDTGVVFNLRNLKVVDGNSLEGAGQGAGLFNRGGEVKVTNSTFSGNSADNSGGGILNAGGTMTVTNSTISGNSAGLGGGILNTGGGTLKVSNSTISGNSAHESNGGGGIYNEQSTLTVSNSTISGNSSVGPENTGDGGGITNASATLKVINSTISGNSVGGRGGGIRNAGGSTLEVINSTFSGNSAGEFGGGIFSQSSLEVTNSTFSGNSAGELGGGGIFVEVSTATLDNTIVANSTQGGNCTEGFAGTIVDGRYNIEDADTCGFSAANNSMPSTDPLLSANLANNGGPTKTIRLLTGSPAIDAIREGKNGCGTKITTDQRGVTRPQGEGCDVGAFEKEQP